LSKHTINQTNKHTKKKNKKKKNKKKKKKKKENKLLIYCFKNLYNINIEDDKEEIPKDYIDFIQLLQTAYHLNLERVQTKAKDHIEVSFNF